MWCHSKVDIIIIIDVATLCFKFIIVANNIIDIQ